MTIPKELLIRFDTAEARKEIIEKYADEKAMYSGENIDGETIYLAVTKKFMVLKTEQENGWVRVTYYDANGNWEGETFERKE